MEVYLLMGCVRRQDKIDIFQGRRSKDLFKDRKEKPPNTKFSVNIWKYSIFKDLVFVIFCGFLTLCSLSTEMWSQ